MDLIREKYESIARKREIGEKGESKKIDGLSLVEFDLLDKNEYK